jgi:hypothetical protein
MKATGIGNGQIMTMTGTNGSRDGSPDTAKRGCMSQLTPKARMTMNDIKNVMGQLTEAQQNIVKAGAQLEAMHALLQKELDETKRRTLHFMHHLDEVFGAINVNRDQVREAVKNL